jgi:hypothetical protein
MKYSTLVLTTLLLLCFSIQAQTSVPDDGKIKDGVYYNSFFNFSFTYPKDWVVSDEAMKARIQERAEEHAAKNGNLAQMKDAYLLLPVSQYPLGTPGIALNPTILLAAEKISQVPGNPTAKDFLLGYREIKVKQGIPSILSEPVEFRVSGLQFFRDDYQGEIRGVSISQSSFVLFKKGYALVITFTGEDRKAVEEMANSMKTIRTIGRGGNRP